MALAALAASWAAAAQTVQAAGPAGAIPGGPDSTETFIAPDAPGATEAPAGPDVREGAASAVPGPVAAGGSARGPATGPWSLPRDPSALELPRAATLALAADTGPALGKIPAQGEAFVPLDGFRQGLGLLRAGRFAEAAVALRAASEHPLAGFAARDAALAAGYALEAAGDHAAARAQYERWIAAGGENSLTPVVQVRLAATAAAAGDYAAARDTAQRLCLTRPWTDAARDAAALARALFVSGRSDFDPDAPHVALAQAERAIDASRPAAAAGILDRLAAAPGDKDMARLDYLRGKIDFAARRTDAALARFRSVRERFPASPIAPWAAYHEARCLWRKTDPESAAGMEALLRGVADDAGLETRVREVSARHLMLLLTEQGRLSDALAAADALAGLGKGGELAEQARGLSGVLCFALGRMEDATRRLSGYLRDYPQSDWAPGARYWLGRTLGAVGDDIGAAACHLGNMALSANTYYGLRSAAMLQALANPGRVNPAAVQPFLYPPGVAAPLPAGPPLCPPDAGSGAETRSAALRAMRERAGRLDAAGLSELAELDMAWQAAAVPRDAELALDHIRLATRLFRLGPATATAKRTFGDCLMRGDPARFGELAAALYPRRHVAAIRAALAGSDVSENLILGLIRQESFFNPAAVSGAGAVGLMQLLPQTAANMAAKVGMKPFAAGMLTDPAVNIRLGVAYYAMRHAQYGHPAHTLCSYNAGAGKLAVWMQGLGGLEPDLFVEFIPYEETRDYVRKVLTNAMFYERLPGGE
jgi:soluble lytic murein transglycosylase